MEQAEKNQTVLIVIAVLAFLLILFILLYLSARDKAKDRKLDIRDLEAEIAKVKDQLAAKNTNTEELTNENYTLSVQLEKERTRNESLSAKVEEFQKITAQMDTKMEELQKRVANEISPESKQKLDDIEISSAKMEKLKALHEKGVLSDEEFAQRKNKLLEEIG